MLEPVEISFKVPFTGVVTSQLKLRNPSDRPVFFKVKDNAPRCYCVRPNSGVVKPGDTVNITVMPQPVGQAATLESERSRREFMIQTAFGPDADTPVDTFWKTADLSQVMDCSVDIFWSSAVNTATQAPREHRDISANSSECSATAQTAHSPSQQASLVREVENRMRVKDDKVNSERESRELRAENDAMKAELRNITKQEVEMLKRTVGTLNGIIDTQNRIIDQLKPNASVDNSRKDLIIEKQQRKIDSLKSQLEILAENYVELRDSVNGQQTFSRNLHDAIDTTNCIFRNALTHFQILEILRNIFR